MDQLDLRIKPRMLTLDADLVTRPVSMLKAFTMAADLGGLSDKQAADVAGMDATTWSRFKAGAVGIKPAAFELFMDGCGNELPLHYLAYRRGYDLVPHLTEMERRLEAERARVARLEQENQLLRSLMTGRAV